MKYELPVNIWKDVLNYSLLKNCKWKQQNAIFHSQICKTYGKIAHLNFVNQCKVL